MTAEWMGAADATAPVALGAFYGSSLLIFTMWANDVAITSGAVLQFTSNCVVLQPGTAAGLVRPTAWLLPMSRPLFESSQGQSAVGTAATIPAYLADIFGTSHVGGIHGRLLTAWSAAGIAGPATVTALRKSANDDAIAELTAAVDPTVFAATFGLAQNVGRVQSVLHSC